MLSFNPVAISETRYQAHELTFNEALKISAIDSRLNERRLSEFLRCVYEVEPLSMSVWQRYFLLLKYLEQQTDGMLALELDFAPYYRPIQNLDDTGSPLQPLTGRDVEYFEQKCRSIGEWVACAMAVQLQMAEHEALQGVRLPEADFESWFLPRLEYIKSLPLSDFNLLFEHYCDLTDSAINGIEFSFNDEGVVLRGGTDDAPMRFCPSACFSGLIAELDSHHSG